MELVCCCCALPFQTNLEEFDFTNINGVLLVFSVADAKSLRIAQEMKTEIEDAVTRRRPQQLRFLLVGNKSDLGQDRQVTEAQGQEIATELGCEYMEVSARNESKLIRGAFQLLLQKMRAAKKRRARRYWTSVVDQVVNSGSSNSRSTPSTSSMTQAYSALGHGHHLNVPLVSNNTASSSSCDSLLSPISPTSIPSPLPSASPVPTGVSFEFARQTSVTPDDGIAVKRSSLKRSVMKRVSSFRGTGRQVPAGRYTQRRHSRASLETDF